MSCWTLLGMNYGNHYLSGLAFNAQYVDDDLTWIWSQGVRRIKIASGDLGNVIPLDAFHIARLATLKQVAMAAKAKGFYVIYGVTGAGGLNDTNWTTYTTNVAAVADDLWNNGSPVIDEFYIGNELELLPSGPSSLQAKILALATDIKTNHFKSDGLTTFVSYNLPQGSSGAWIAAGIGDLDHLGYDGYNSGSGSFDAEMINMIAAFGRSKVYWSEWNVNSTWTFENTNNTNVCENIEEECVQLYTRLQKIKALGLPAYFFTYRWDQNGDAFSLYNSVTGQHRKWTDILFNRTRLETTTQRLKNTINHGFAHDSSDAARRCRRTGSLLTGISPGSAYTVSLWIYPTSFSGAPRIYQEAASGSGSTTGGFSMQLSGSTILISLNTSTGTKVGNLSAQDLQLNLNQWNHVVWRDNNGKATVYINNARGLRPYNYVPSGTYLTDLASVGIEVINNFNNFAGRIDELAIYPIALTWAQIRLLYERGDSNLPGVSKNLYLKFDEGSGTTVSDSSGNGQNFTLASATGAWAARPAETVARSNNSSTRSKNSSERVSALPLFEHNSIYTPIWLGTGINYGHDTQNGVPTYPNGIVKTQQFNQDLQAIRGMGITKLRIAMNDYSYAAGIAMSKALALQAKAMGFYVAWGVDVPGGFGQAKDSTWAAYVKAVYLAADWAQANRMDEFMISNEIEYSQTVTHNLTNAVDKLLSLGAGVKLNHFFKNVSTAVGQDSLESEWIAKGRGYIDLMGYNVYGTNGDFTDWKNKITTFHTAFGDHFQVSEWNLNSNWSQFPPDPAVQVSDIADRVNWLSTSGVNLAYFFNWRWDDNNGNFGLFVGGNARSWFPSLFH